jgi:hypothetical protein
LAARVNPLGENTTLGETLRQYVAPCGLALCKNWGIILYMETALLLTAMFYLKIWFIERYL